MKFIKKIINKIKEKKDYKEENEDLRNEIKDLLNKIDVKDNRIDELEFELTKDFQAQKIENLENLATKLREAKKANADEIQKERRKRIEAQEKLRDVESKYKRLEQELRILKKVGV